MYLLEEKHKSAHLNLPLQKLCKNGWLFLTDTEVKLALHPGQQKTNKQVDNNWYSHNND